MTAWPDTIARHKLEGCHSTHVLLSMSFDTIKSNTVPIRRKVAVHIDQLDDL